MITNSHKRFYYENITPQSIDIMDIAHALSNTCRFGGHVNEFYSVAQHSVFVSNLVPSKYQLAALLHDASEAYLSDIVSPAKRMLEDYKSLEADVMQAIEKKFNINTKVTVIKLADTNALYAEALHFYGNVKEWGIDDFHNDYKIEPLEPKRAKEQFLQRYAELTTITDPFFLKSRSRL